MRMQQTVSDVLHKLLRLPYTLHVHEFRSPKRPRATYVFIHGIGNTLHSWDEVVAGMPKDVRIIGIDLLGFGASPRPNWVVYNARTQARSVGATLLKLRLTQRPVIVGHSLGALVAVEVARRYKLLPKELVLCSPPFYSPVSDELRPSSPDALLRKIYMIAKKHPEQLQQWSPIAVKLGLANKALNITRDNVTSYTAALESSIINQTSLHDVATIRLPITIFYGAFDPVVIKKYITALAKNNSNITAKLLSAGHEVVGRYAKTLTRFLSTHSLRR